MLCSIHNCKYKIVHILVYVLITVMSIFCGGPCLISGSACGIYEGNGEMHKFFSKCVLLLAISLLMVDICPSLLL